MSRLADGPSHSTGSMGSPGVGRRSIPPGKKGSFLIVSELKTTMKSLNKVTTTANQALRSVWHQISTLPDGTKASVIADILIALNDFSSHIEEHKDMMMKSLTMAKSAAEHVTTNADDKEITTSTVEMEHAVPNYDLKKERLTGGDGLGSVKSSGKGSPKLSPKLSPKISPKTSPKVTSKAKSPLIMRPSGHKRSSSAGAATIPRGKGSLLSSQRKSDGSSPLSRSDSDHHTMTSTELLEADAGSEQAEEPKAGKSNPVTLKDVAEVIVESTTKADGYKIGVYDVAAEAMRKKKAKRDAAARAAALDEMAAAAKEADAELLRVQAAERAAALKKNPWSAVTPTLSRATTGSSSPSSSKISTPANSTGGSESVGNNGNGNVDNDDDDIL